MQVAFITGVAGFIGFHLAKRLLEAGWSVAGFDAVTDYYDVKLKWDRLEILQEHPGFSFSRGELEDVEAIRKAAVAADPEVIVHLAAQAGVRYSLEAPRAYIDSNVIGTFNVMEIARQLPLKHLLMASTSSAYGANTEMPFSETQKADTQLTIYAATKKANEVMAHAYSHLYQVPTTMFRFFTVYGPWGRPDMALFKFTKGIIDGAPIDVYNNGEMWRDFTYVDDLVCAIHLLFNAVPGDTSGAVDNDSLSPVAPFRIVNIGNSEKVRLLDFVDAIEAALGKRASRNYMALQTGDVPATWSDVSLLKTLTGYRPQTSVQQGIDHFVSWYREYYKV